MSRSTSVKGFPEWLPDQRMVEQHLIDIIRARYELHGFVPVETRAVEPVDVLTSKGEVDKEIYVLRRIHACRPKWRAVEQKRFNAHHPARGPRILFPETLLVTNPVLPRCFARKA